MNNQNIQNRYEFVLLFDVKDGNPNGDPDAANTPRTDAETGMGLVTDVCLKRKVRNYIQLTQAEKPGFDIFVKEKAILNDLIDQAHDQAEVKDLAPKDKTEAARQWMTRKYYDIRTFGAVLTTGKNAGQVRGAAQFTFARSIDPIATAEHTITRLAITTKEDSDKQKSDNRTMGRKYTVPYALYRAHGFISPHLAAQTGFAENDLELLWQALTNMFDHDHSAARGEMNTRALIIFKHDTALGNAPAHQLFDTVEIKTIDTTCPPRNYRDYQVTIDESKIPQGVTLIKRVF